MYNLLDLPGLQYLDKPKNAQPVTYGNNTVTWSPTVTNSPALKTSTGKGGFITPAGDVLGAQTGGGGTGGGNPSGSVSPTNGGIDFGAIINQANEQLRRAREQAAGYYDLANNFFDQGMTTLGQKRSEFQKNFDATQGDILGGYEKNRGELQASAAGARTRSANALRALGLGGSAVINTEGRQQQNNAKALANLQDQRTQSDRQNVANLNDQNTWANTQESSLKNYLKEAGLQKAQLEGNAITGFDSILNNIVSQKAALEAAKNNINGYTVNPIAVNADQWTSAVNDAGTGLTGLGSGSGQDPNAGVNIQNDQTILAMLKKQYPTLFGIN